MRLGKWFEKPLLGSQINWGHPLTSGLVGCWLMNENGGKVISDLLGRSNGALTTPEWYAGDINLSGGSYGEISNKFLAFAKGSFILQFLTYSTSNYQGVFANCDLGNSLNGCTLYEQDGALVVRGTAGGVGIGTILLAQKNIAFIQWDDTGSPSYGGRLNNLTYSSSGNLMSMNPANVVRLGRTGDAFWSNYTGRIQALYWYNRILTVQEVRDIFQSPYCFISRPVHGTYSIPAGVTYRRRILVGG